MGSTVSKQKSNLDCDNNQPPEETTKHPLKTTKFPPHKTNLPPKNAKPLHYQTDNDITVPKKSLRIVALSKPLPLTALPPSDVDKITLEEAANKHATTTDEMWKIVKQSSDLNFIDLKPSTKRKGWKTIRLFVSSTFRDFHQEREVLVKEVFPDLRLWCESRKLRLVECDLRWGVPKDSTTEETIKICLSELDRCYEDNTAPFFLNLAGDRAGWIPKFDDFSMNLAVQYGWVFGLAVTEMEIVHGAIRKLNPNALFLLRNMEGKDMIPDEAKAVYYNDNQEIKEKLEKLKYMINDTFPPSNVKNYNVSCKVKEDQVVLSGLTGEDMCFSNMVFEFFRSKIEELYPLDSCPSDPLQIQRDSHEMFLDSRSSVVLGRDDMLAQIEDYVINGNTSMAPVILVGTAGAGKSALIAKSAHRATELAKQNAIKMQSTSKCRVFFHFVGATPRSSDLASFLQRLTKEIKPNQKDAPSDLDTLISLSYNLMKNDNTEPIIIFVDAINQIDEYKQQYLNRWLPETLSANVRVVISTIESTVSHQTVRTFKTNPTEIVCGPLDKESSRVIVENILSIYNKRLDDEQITVLLNKKGSSNPLWLTLACEELRVYGQYRTLIDKIHRLPDDLISLEEEVFARFEEETAGDLMKACVCMLEVSRHGLLETELLALLGDAKNVKVPEYTETDEDSLIKCGGYGVASAVYKEQLSILRTSDMPLIEYDEIDENVNDAIEDDQYSEAIELKEERLIDEITHVTEHPVEMVYQNFASHKIELMERPLNLGYEMTAVSQNMACHEIELMEPPNLAKEIDDISRNKAYHEIELIERPLNKELTHLDEQIDEIADVSQNMAYHEIEVMERPLNEEPTHLDERPDDMADVSQNMAYHEIEVIERPLNEELPFLDERVDEIADVSQNMAYHEIELTEEPLNEELKHLGERPDKLVITNYSHNLAEVIEVKKLPLNGELTLLRERPDEMANISQNMAYHEIEVIERPLNEELPFLDERVVDVIADVSQNMAYHEIVLTVDPLNEKLKHLGERPDELFMNYHNDAEMIEVKEWPFNEEPTHLDERPDDMADVSQNMVYHEIELTEEPLNEELKHLGERPDKLVITNYSHNLAEVIEVKKLPLNGDLTLLRERPDEIADVSQNMAYHEIELTADPLNEKLKHLGERPDKLVMNYHNLAEVIEVKERPFNEEPTHLDERPDDMADVSQNMTYHEIELTEEPLNEELKHLGERPDKLAIDYHNLAGVLQPKIEVKVFEDIGPEVAEVITTVVVTHEPRMVYVMEKPFNEMANMARRQSEKTETNQETTEDIEETKQNLTKLVQETYVKEEGGDKSKDGKEKSHKVPFKRPRGKQINFLPARDWALLYRNLKPLLRPCGDLGEGRLDFYHRSLSKAARRSYFSGEEKVKKHVYNFWHGVLADYFEDIDDMDRKAEELPYHLEQLQDSNRLIRCLMDWEVFDRLYSEDFSIDLLHSWRACGGYGVASAVYKEQLSILRKSDMPLIEYVEIVENVYGFMIQAGQYSEAIELMEERLNDELTHLGERPDEMADVYQNMARCKSEIDKAQQYMGPRQIDDNRLIVKYGRKCLDYRKQLSGADNDYQCALANILISHHLSKIAKLTDKLETRTEAFAAIEEADKVFRDMNDIGHMAECAMTKAIIDPGKPFAEYREPLLKESLTLCLKGYGEHHLLTTRIYLNTGIAYEVNGDIGTAFQYFKKLKEICLAVFGPGHPKTVRAIKTINGPRYKTLLMEEERRTAEVA